MEKTKGLVLVVICMYMLLNISVSPMMNNNHFTEYVRSVLNMYLDYAIQWRCCYVYYTYE